MPALLRALACAALIVAITTTARAGEAVMSAVSYDPLPNERTISVEAYDNSEDTVAMQKAIEAALQSRGYSLAKDSRLVLSFEHRDTSGSWTGGGSNRLIELRNQDDHTGAKAPEVRVSIYDTTRGGLINPKRSSGITQVTPSHYRIDFSLEDRTNGRRFWQAWSETAIGAADDPAARQAMIGPMIKSLGETVRDQHFPIN